MIQVSYAEIESDSLMGAREREKQVLDQSVTLMDQAIADGPNSIAAIEAMHFTVRVWTHLMQDLAGPDNEFPDDLRASLISIGIWILKEAEAIRQGEGGSIDQIRDITAIIREGLQ